MKALLRAAKRRRELKWLAPLATRAAEVGAWSETRLLRWAGGEAAGGVWGTSIVTEGFFGKWSQVIYSTEGIKENSM